MSVVLCQLCGNYPAIANSHVIPAFVYRAIRSDSPTGFFRNPNNLNQRIQDGDKTQLLCQGCEQRFAVAERKFASEIFSPFHETDRDEFPYGPLLHYFMTSLAWRTLILDRPGFESNPACPRAAVAELAEASETMRNYLLGSSDLAGCICNHAVVWTKGDVASAQLAAAGPNVMIRRSVFGYTVLDPQRGYSGVLHNLAGFMCFLIVKGDPRDTWNGTKIIPEGGEITQPQKVSSWLIGELLSCIVKSGQKQATMSAVQLQKIGDSLEKNPSARALRFWEFDKRVVHAD